MIKAYNLFSMHGDIMAVETLVINQFIAYNNHDSEAFVACFSADFRAWRMPVEQPSLIGKDNLRTFYQQNRFNNPALRAELITRTVMGNKVFDHELIYGIAEQPIESMAVFEVNDELISKAWFYFP